MLGKPSRKHALCNQIIPCLSYFSVREARLLLRGDGWWATIILIVVPAGVSLEYQWNALDSQRQERTVHW